jgi:capsular exopolysaccharide synthesis family protein
LQKEAPGFFPVVALTEKRAKDGTRLSGLARLLSGTPELKDAYSALLSGLRLNTRLNSGNAVLVTSTQPNEGKTTVAVCLAITAALAGERALLIDGDLRRRWLSSAAGIADDAGLGEILEGRAEPAEAIHPVELFDGRRDTGPLSVMTAGGKSPSFLPALDWTNARSVFRSFAGRFGLVALDSPPILAVNDALLLAGIVDGVVLVIDAGTADRYEVKRAREQLEPIGTPILGAVLNRFDPKLHGRPNHPYRSYYLDSPSSRGADR